MDVFMDQASKSPTKEKQSSLVTANEMFKDAFLFKKMRFSSLYPELSEPELHKMTTDYFKSLAKKGKI